MFSPQYKAIRLAQLHRQVICPDIHAPILHSGSMEVFNSISGPLTIISHPAYWRVANEKIRSMARSTYRSGQVGDSAERIIKQDMIHSAYGKGFLFEAQFEYALWKAQQDRSPVLITMDFCSKHENRLALSDSHKQALIPYINWCLSRYSDGNVFILPTRKSSGRIIDDPILKSALKACEVRDSITLQGGIISACLLETAHDLFNDSTSGKSVRLNDRYCYSSSDAYMPPDYLKSRVYFERGVQAWGELNISPMGNHRCNETILFHTYLPEIKIVY